MWTLIALAAASPVFPVVGTMTDDVGIPVQGAQSVGFGLYDAPTGGATLWTDTDTVLFEDGTFRAVLGAGAAAINPADLREASLWLAVRVGDGEWSPRVQVLGAPIAWFAHESAVADLALDAERLGGALPAA